MLRPRGARQISITAAVLFAIVLIAALVVAPQAYDAYLDSKYDDIINGPDLEPTDNELSLTADFLTAESWSAAALASAFQWADERGATAVIVLDRGRVVAEWGDTALISDVHSVRKSIVSALYGIAIERGLVDKAATLAELDVDDKPPLTEQERSATIDQILASTSGIYHDSVRDDDPEGRPKAGSHPPGEQFYYNNWGFNAAGGILEGLVGLSLGEAFQEWIAAPVSMQDFRISDVRYETSGESTFPAYRFRLSTRDMARFGLLMEQNGVWDGQQIVPTAWIEESTEPQTAIRDTLGYGDMWWTDGDAFFASGTGGQRVYIDPSSGLVIAIKVNTGNGKSRARWVDAPGPNITYGQFREFLDLITAASPDQRAR